MKSGHAWGHMHMVTVLSLVAILFFHILDSLNHTMGVLPSTQPVATLGSSFIPYQIAINRYRRFLKCTAHIVGRGGTSGIGITAAEVGGFIVAPLVCLYFDFYSDL